ncbi:unnamed protein product [Sphagnum troendelagicum]|uniref:Ferredoxin-dependent bilin reductase n=1 Tax=Sphagnum troendelagicum TaxID=128251 RepID=A0ABP0TKM7_9BRYO
METLSCPLSQKCYHISRGAIKSRQAGLESRTSLVELAICKLGLPKRLRFSALFPLERSWGRMQVTVGVSVFGLSFCGSRRLQAAKKSRSNNRWDLEAIRGVRAELSCARAKNKGLYDDFLDFAVEKLHQHVQEISKLPIQDEFSNMVALDGVSLTKNCAYESAKIRIFRAASIDAGNALQVLNLAICARPEYDLPIFCTDFVSTASRNIIVLDLNPLHNIEQNPEYKEKYFSELLPMANKYAQILPWGDKLTAESIQFFSPIVIWSRPHQREDIQNKVFPAFQDYLEAWLQMVDIAQPTTNPEQISKNQEAHHRYLMWRATKDPGRNMLARLYGEQLCERYISEFMFNGVNTLGTKGFLDYFPEYNMSDGSISKQRSVLGRSYEQRPWDSSGHFNPVL